MAGTCPGGSGHKFHAVTFGQGGFIELGRIILDGNLNLSLLGKNDDDGKMAERRCPGLLVRAQVNFTFIGSRLVVFQVSDGG